MANFICGVGAYLGVSDSEDLGLDGVVGDGHCIRGRAVLAGTRDQASANNGLDAGVDVLRVIDDDRGLVTTPATAGPLEKNKPD